LLSGTSLGLERTDLVLTVQARSADMLLGEQINKRAGQLAAALGLALKVKLK
jgi:hypothetical protein